MSLRRFALGLSGFLLAAAATAGPAQADPAQDLLTGLATAASPTAYLRSLPPASLIDLRNQTNSLIDAYTLDPTVISRWSTVQTQSFMLADVPAVQNGCFPPSGNPCDPLPYAPPLPPDFTNATAYDGGVDMQSLKTTTAGSTSRQVITSARNFLGRELFSYEDDLDWNWGAGYQVYASQFSFDRGSVGGWSFEGQDVRRLPANGHNIGSVRLQAIGHYQLCLAFHNLGCIQHVSAHVEAVAIYGGALGGVHYTAGG